MSDNGKEQSRQDLERRLRELREAKDRKSPEFQQKQREVSRDLCNSIDRGDFDTRTERNGAVFYDNGGKFDAPIGMDAKDAPAHWKSNEDRAKAFCDQPGNEHCRTIGRTPGGKWMNDQKLYEALPREDAKQAWGKLSAQYARNASGEVHAFSHTRSADQNVFKPIEQVELQRNPNVTGIAYHHSEPVEMIHHQHLRKAPPAQSSPPPPSAAGPPPRSNSVSPAAGPPPRSRPAPENPAPNPDKGRSR